MSDDGVRATNNDAAQCKRWAVEKGYYHDNFIKYFVPTASSKTPEISRGYYARVQGMRQMVAQFISSHNAQCQVVSVGAGSDTMFWWLGEQGNAPKTYVELDFPQITMKKFRLISKHAAMRDVLSNTSNVRGNLHSDGYHLIGLDLRDGNALTSVLTSCSLDPTLPTLVLAECVLCYMSPEYSNALIVWAAIAFSNAVFVNYEPTNMNDRFGDIMIENMRARQCELPGILACQTLADQETRFISAGFTTAKAYDMCTVLSLLPQPDVERVNSIEMFDEVELLTQLLQHYCIAWGSKGNVHPVEMGKIP